MSQSVPVRPFDLVGLAIAGCVCALIGAGIPLHAQTADTDGAGQYGPSIVPLADAASGLAVSDVDVRIGRSSGDPARDEAVRLAVARATASLAGQPYRPLLLEHSLAQLVAKGTVSAATQRPALDPGQNRVAVVVTLDLAPVATAGGPPTPTEPEFPVIYQDDRTKLTFIIGGGVGAYSDGNPWFGQPLLFNEFNPLAGNLPDERTTWGEGYIELGLGGATQVADTPFYVFGAASAIGSFSLGQDIFSDTDRTKWHPEKGYVGVLYADPESGNTAQLSFGRQTWTLNDGFLISMVSGSSNAGERGATYLGPRNSTDFTALATGNFGRASFALFYIDPDELESLESNTTFAGLNAGYRFSDSLSGDVSFIAIPTSDSSYSAPGGIKLAREGTETVGLHGLYRPTKPDHFWVEAEYYRQSNSSYSMSADAWYGTVGHIWRSARWSPSISFRLASFSGDDPRTPEFERFDSLMSTGLGNWLQGISFGKVYRNANLNTFRVQANVVPSENMNLTFTWHKLEADQLNNLGGNPALASLNSTDIGDEFTATLRWAIDRNRYLQIVGSRAVPGDALKSLGADEPWTTLQASLYINF